MSTSIGHKIDHAFSLYLPFVLLAAHFTRRIQTFRYTVRDRKGVHA